MSDLFFLDKEWYTVTETSKILNIPTSTIRFRIKYKQSSVNKLEESEFKKEKGKYFIHKDYINRHLEKVWFTVPETCKLLNKSENWLYYKYYKGKMKETDYNNEKKLLIHISYINEQREYFKNLKEFYYTYNEAAQILEKTISSIYGLVTRGVFTDVIKNSSGSYISKKEVERYKEKYENTIPLSTIQKELNLSKYQALELIKNEPLISENNVTGQYYVIKNKSYQKFKEELVFTKKMVSEFLRTSSEVINMLIEKKYIEFFQLDGVGWRTSKYYLEKYLNQGKMPLEQLALEMNTKGETLLPYIRSGELKGTKYQGIYYIKVDEAERFKNSFTAIKIRYYNSDDFYNYLADGITFFRKNTMFKETVDLYETWARKRIKKIRVNDLKPTVSLLLYSLESLLRNINKDLFLYTDNELKELFKLILDTHLKSLYPFFSYYKKMKMCKFNGDYVWKNSKSRTDEPYTKKEWKNFTLDVLDIDKHFENALKSKKYANTWLWTLLHFSLDWRSKDLRKFKSFNLDIVGISSFDWFADNTFTLEISQSILKSIERNMSDVKANKNKKELVFVIPFIFELPTALAFTLCELHRRQIDKHENHLITSSINIKDLREFFGEGLPDFSNRKCSKSLTTYGWETAVKKGKGALAYWLGGFARSHTQKIDIPNPVTQVYIVTNNSDLKVEEMALHAFEIGIFGWQVKVMIDAINNHEPLSLDEMTKAITEVNNIYTPIMVDSISKYAITRHEQSISLLKELMVLPKDKLVQKLEEISKLQSPSLLDHSQCLVGVKNCPHLKVVEYNLETPCFGCKYRIDTNYILDVINVELFTLMDRLNQTPSWDKTSRIKYTHMIRTLSYILMDFKRAFDKYDPGYIRSFIDMDELKKQFEMLEITKFLRIE
jgi:hypothetical protein